MTPLIQDAIKKAGGAKRCTYCGLVYLPAGGVRLGWWNSGILGEGWHERRSPY
nr:hypothetical protein [Pseudomonas aeruginosa]